MYTGSVVADLTQDCDDVKQSTLDSKGDMPHTTMVFRQIGKGNFSSAQPLFVFFGWQR